jgi:tetratricopeptide (TPR) repeat protein
LKANWKACPECGTPVQQAAVCAGCGAELKANWKACPVCGTPVQAAASPGTPAQPAGKAASGPGGAEAPIALAKEYEDKGDFDNAIAEYTKAIKLDPDNAAAYRSRGEMYSLDKDDSDRAIADYTQAIKLDPDNAEAYTKRGGVYRQKGQYDAAINDLDAALRLDPNYASAYFYRGGAYYMKGQYDAAINDFDAAIRLNPNYAYAYANRGEAYRIKGQYDAAINEFDAAIRLSPNYAWAYANRGDAYNQKGQKNQAIADLEKAVNLDPNNTWAKDRLREIRGHENQAASPNSSGGCFITSAVCGSFAKPDDCYELTLFRQFRDGWLAAQPEGPALIEQYYRAAPAIVAAIDRRPDRDAVYRGVWDAWLAPCLRAIENGQLEDCKGRYISMVETLGAEYL